MNIRGIRASKKDGIGTALMIVINDWIANGEAGDVWMNNLECAYNFTKFTGCTLGLFSNLPAKLGEVVEELPWLQVQSEPLKLRLQMADGWKTNYGLDEYFGERYKDVAHMTVPFLAFANYLYLKGRNRLWNVEVGDYRKAEPLILTFECRKDLVKLVIYGHVLVRDANYKEQAQGNGVCYID